jgi:hypothetical protein
MVDQPSHYKPLDPGRVDTLDRVELQYWCKELHCNEDELMDAVSKVGEHIAALREYLASRR